MAGIADWACIACGRLIESTATRRCPSCGGIDFHPLADEVPGDDPGTVTFEIDVEAALEHLDADES